MLRLFCGVHAKVLVVAWLFIGLRFWRILSSETSRESESEWDPAWTFIPELFLSHTPFLFPCFLLSRSGSRFGPVSCTHADRFARNQRMIALRSTASVRKTQEGWKIKNRVGLARATGSTGIQRPGWTPALISVRLKYLWKVLEQELSFFHSVHLRTSPFTSTY